MMAFSIDTPAWQNGERIPEKYAFGVPAEEERIALSDNVNPRIGWSDVPEGTKSFAVICYDPDVPASAENVLQEGKVVPSDLENRLSP